jgi:hypothetical protein
VACRWVIQHVDAGWPQGVCIEYEPVVLPQKRHLAATVGTAFWLVFRALIE